MIETEILEALQKATTTAVANSITPALPIKYLGRTFDIPNNGRYLEVVYIPNNVNNEFWGNGKTYRGLYRLILHWGLDDAGAYPPMRALSSICDGFVKGSVFQNGAVSVTIYDEPDLTTVSESAPEMLFLASVRYSFFNKP